MGKQGFFDISPSNTQPDLTEAIINISKSPRIARHQAEQAYSRLLETFSVEVMVLKTLKVYSSVLKNRI